MGRTIGKAETGGLIHAVGQGRRSPRHPCQRWPQAPETRSAPWAVLQAAAARKPPPLPRRRPGPEVPECRLKHPWPSPTPRRPIPASASSPGHGPLERRATPPDAATTAARSAGRTPTPFCAVRPIHPIAYDQRAKYHPVGQDMPIMTDSRTGPRPAPKCHSVPTESQNI